MLTDLPRKTPDARLQAELEFLFGRINYERTTKTVYPRYFKLESMRRLLGELGDPQNSYSIIHVAGTKGKGSVCKMIAGALNAGGIRTGVYSSPHIETIRERICVGGVMVSESQLASLLEKTHAAVRVLDEKADHEGFRKNSFFEVITATALLHFYEQSAQKVVLEVGLGGRLDSTNVCDPELCVITNISLDHTKQLGSTVDRIAREKAGIIKPGVPVVSGVKDPLAAREIHETCSVCNSDLMEIGEDFHFRINSVNNQNQTIMFDTFGTLPEQHRYQLQDVVLNSPGRHQVSNATVAVAALNLLPDRFNISQAAIRKSLVQFAMIGRGEVLCQEPLVIVDIAHNVASIQALTEMLDRLRPADSSIRRRRLVFATSRDKDLPGMLSRLLPSFEDIVFTRFVENPRATEPAELLESANSVLIDAACRPRLSIADDPPAAWELIKKTLRPEDLFCVSGSAFLVAEMRPLLVEHFGCAESKPP